MKPGETKAVVEYSMHVVGLWGRNRKMKRELFSLKELCEQPLSMDEVRTLARAKCLEIKLKPGAKLQVREYPVTAECCGIGDLTYVTKSFMCFSDKLMFNEEWNG